MDRARLVESRALGSLLVAALLVTVGVAAASRTVWVSSGSTDPAAVEDVRAALSPSCRCAGRYRRCARGIARAALQREPPVASAGDGCTDPAAVEPIRMLLSSACGEATSRARYLRCARAVVRAAIQAGPLPLPLPTPVTARQEPEGIRLGNPAFEPLPGARADFGRLGGAVYQIEMPDDWNGRLVLFMHGYNELGPEADVSPPDFRAYLILHGYAWGASSFSSTSWIAGRAADETAALWDFFTRRYGRPCRAYVTGFSMGGAATHIAAERYPYRFDGALAACGTPGFVEGQRYLADYFAAGSYVAGVSQGEVDAAADVGSLVPSRILPVLDDPAAHERFESILLDLTGGPRAFDREGFRLEEALNWRRTQLTATLRILPNAGREYRLGPLSSIPSDEFNRAAVRLTTNDALLGLLAEGQETTGDVRMPLLALYATGDGQVPIVHAQTLRQRVDAAGKGDRLVQRVFRDVSHCGFSTAEQEEAFEALVGWVERGVRPPGDDVLVADLRTLSGQFELSPRPGTPEGDAVTGAADRVLLHGHLTLDGAPFDAQFLGAVVRRDGLVTPCQLALSSVDDGRYEITVRADTESTGCGVPGAEILLWTFAANQILYAREWTAWPGNGGTVAANASFSASAPLGAAPPKIDFNGELFRRDGVHLPPGTRVEAFVGDVRCGVASTQRTGNFSGYILSVVGPESVPGCERDATLRFRIDGQRAAGTAVNGNGGRGGLDLILPRGPLRPRVCP